MRKITVRASKIYDILIGSGLLKQCGKYTSEVSKAKKAAIITDDTVNSLYGAETEKSLAESGFSVCKFVFPHGEASKCSDTLLKMYEFLAVNDITRADLLVALGGGVVGDITGFCAATFLRGVDFVQIPTTLLAQVDSSVGGKTAINIKAGKNLVGAFNQPLLVISDTDTLNTLTDDIFADGMGEVIKYGMIRSKELFDLLATGKVKENLAEIIAKCVEIKRDVVQNDEHDTGERMILNFGHTLGHAIEKYYNFSDISHGKGVAIGMYRISLLAEKTGLAEKGVAETLRQCLSVNGLPLECPLSAEEMFRLSVNDNKRTSDTIRIVICPQIGSTEIKTMKLADYKAFLEN